MMAHCRGTPTCIFDLSTPLISYPHQKAHPYKLGRGLDEEEGNAAAALRGGGGRRVRVGGGARGGIGKDERAQGTQEEECVGQEKVNESEETYPGAEVEEAGEDGKDYAGETISILML